MRLFEFDNTKNLVIKINALTDQLRTDVEDGKIKSKWSVDKLLKYFQKYDIILDKTDLFKMIQTYPLKNVIKNIQGDDVIFKGMPEEPAADEPPTPQKSKEVVKKMANKAKKSKSK